MVCLRAYPPCQFGQLARIGAIAPPYDDHHIRPARHVHDGFLALLRRRANGVQHLRMLYALANAFAQRLISLDGKRRLRNDQSLLTFRQSVRLAFRGDGDAFAFAPAQNSFYLRMRSLPYDDRGNPFLGRGKNRFVNALNVRAGSVHNRGPARRKTANDRRSHAMGANHNSRPGWNLLFCARNNAFLRQFLHHMRIVDDGTQAICRSAGQRQFHCPAHAIAEAGMRANLNARSSIPLPCEYT